MRIDIQEGMERVLKSKWFHFIGISLITAIGIIVYSNTIYSSFHFDDIPQIVENYIIRDIKNLTDILAGQRGVTMATFALNYAVGGLNVLGYHVVNISIHILNGILFYMVLFLTLNYAQEKDKVDEEWSKWIAVFAAALFTVHPIQTQSVTYIVQRMESLASFFYLLALLLFIKGAEAQSQTKKAVLYSGVALSYILSFYSKEIAITLPIMIVLYDLFFIAKGSGVKGLVKRWHLYLALLGIMLYLSLKTIYGLGGFGDLSEETAGMGNMTVTVEKSAGFDVTVISPLEYLFTQFNVILYYITLLFFPINQNLDYDFPVSMGLFEIPKITEGTVLNIPLPPPAVSLVILLSIIGAAFYLYRQANIHHTPVARAASFFILWFFIILLPTSSFVPIIDVIFEHRVYLASAGFFVIFALIVDYGSSRIAGWFRLGKVS